MFIPKKGPVVMSSPPIKGGGMFKGFPLKMGGSFPPSSPVCWGMPSPQLMMPQNMWAQQHMMLCLISMMLPVALWMVQNMAKVHQGQMGQGENMASVPMFVPSAPLSAGIMPSPSPSPAVMMPSVPFVQSPPAFSFVAPPSSPPKTAPVLGISPSISMLSPHFRTLSGVNIFEGYAQKTPAEKLQYFEQLKALIGKERHFCLSLDRFGNAMLDLENHGEWREEKRGKRRSNGSLVSGFNSGLCDRAQDMNDGLKRFTSENLLVIPVKGKEKNTRYPHLLVVPRVSPQRPPYEDFREFLMGSEHRPPATPEEKIQLLDKLHDLKAALPAGVPPRQKKTETHVPYEQLFHVNNGRRREVPLMHIHFKPQGGPTMNYKSLLV